MADAYASTSGNSTGTQGLKRMQLSFGSTVLKFAVNPEDYTQSMPYRVTVTQTKGGAWLDAWGGGIVEFTIKGTTGVRGSSTNVDVGYQRWRLMRQFFADVYNSVQDGQEVQNLIKFMNYTDNEYWWCYPAQGGLELYRSKSKPHMYQYTIHLLGIRQVGQPETTTETVTTDNPAVVPSSTTTTQGKKTEVTSQADEILSIIGTRTSTKPIYSIRSESQALADTLEPIVGGYSGKLSPATAYRTMKRLSIQASGTVPNVFKIRLGDYTDDTGILIKESEWQSRVSTSTYTLHQKVMSQSLDVMSPDFSVVYGNDDHDRVSWAIANSTDYRSTLYEIINDYIPAGYLNKTDASRVLMILADAMSLYTELYHIADEYDSGYKTGLSTNSMTLLGNNIQALILYLTLKNTNNIESMDIIDQLRKIQLVAYQAEKNIVWYI